MARRMTVAVAVIAASVLPRTALATASDPAQWPEYPGGDPELTATPHTIRYAGADRYQTNLALGLALRGQGDFPFDTSNRTSAGATGLAGANDWWGAASCPRSIIVVAGDTFTDALAAASLSDPRDRSNQPRLQRVAAADPLFDTIGGFDRPDTAFAPVVVTASARSGTNRLAPPARVTATDLRSGGCDTAREAIIVGGTDAVPAGVESELIGIGYREVFRVAGSDRFDTAAQVAAAMGTSEPSADECADPTADDGATRLGWYGNAVAEFRPDADHCRLLPRAVVLADGGTGADALAAGWWTSSWQVPVLLTAADGSLPTATRRALENLEVDTLIVLGGIARIPEHTVDEARFLAGAVAGRIAGRDRTETSVAMAKQLGGWHPTGEGDDFADDIACFAATSGSGNESRGWPDALAGGPACARLGAAAAGSPTRALAPVGGAQASVAVTGRRRPSHDAVPIIVLPTGADAVPAAVIDFLGASFDPTASWCSAERFSSACLGPGFGVVIGGEQGVTAGAAGDLTYLLSGGELLDRGDQTPRLSGTFVTALDLAPVFSRTGAATGPPVCAPTGGLGDVRWLSFTRDVDRKSFVAESDVLRTGVYDRAGRSHAICAAPFGTETSLASAGVSISGHVTAPQLWDLDPAKHLTLSRPLRQAATESLGSSTTRWFASGRPDQPVTIRLGDESAAITSAVLELNMTTDGASGHVGVTGSFTINTQSGPVEGAVTAEAMNEEDVWHVAGKAAVGQFANRETTGGFQATVTQTTNGTVTIAWRVDGY